eukprot:Tamp_24386.p1 GENE.Tamp_24386~~Tamp_24386.p1  ORF type:complete len:160 (+),score=46.68 Tamp_24386:448-927(+)
MNKDEIKDAMTQYAESGRVTSGPAMPKGLARKDPKFEEEFAKLHKKAGDEAPEPTFALGGLKSKKPSKIQELNHSFETVAEGEGAKPVGYKLTIDLPEGITGMEDLDVEVSCHKIEVKCKDGTHALNLVWPSRVDPDAVAAKMRKKLGKLVLSAPTEDA